MLKILPIGGLCNRLRVIFSYYPMAKAKNKTLVVIWINNSVCNGWFLDYFEEIPGIIFKSHNTSNSPIFYEGWDINKNYLPIYESLKLKPIMQNIINQKILELGKDYISIHIRRTDHISLAKKHNSFTTDEEFINFIDKYPNENVYLATDNRFTQDKFITLYPNRIKIFGLINNSNNLRKTSLRDTIIDIYICKEAKYFKGSGRSSLSDFIKSLRDPKHIPYPLL
jgi:hypothetical protein